MPIRILISECFIVSICFLSLFTFSVHAGDGSHPHGITAGGLGTTVTVQDKTFNITGGTQKGNNLFHSFGKFNVHSGETAKFGDSGIRNTIGRITGGEYSWISGTIKSEAENLYLLNPGGFVFGSGAALDLKGSFHVSTADYLKMGDNERFYAKPAENETLSVAEPAAFGFVSDKPAKISAEGAKLQVAEDKNISLIGGDIEISKGTLKARDGWINMAGAGSQGEVVPAESDLIITSSQKGNVSLSDGSLIDVSGTGSGNIFIRGGQFVAEDSSVQADTSAWDGGVINIQADSISFTDGASVISNTFGKGKGGDVILKAAESVSFEGESSTAKASKIEVASTGKDKGGDAGNLTIDAKNISFTDGAYINSSTYGKGGGGEVILKAGGAVSFSGESSRAKTSMIQIATADKEAEAGDAGKLSVDAGNISFGGGAYINSATYGKGKGGEVTLKAAESVSFSGENSKAAVSDITINTQYTGEGAGDAGILTIEAKDISFTKGSYINSNTFGKGNGGEVILKAAESIFFKGESSKAENSSVQIATNNTQSGAGDAGKLTINAKNISFTDGAYITSNTEGKGKGGEVVLNASEAVSFSGKNSNAEVSQILVGTKDKEEGAGDAGKLSIEAKNISFIGGAVIGSDTEGKGKGGEVVLNASEAVLFSGENSNAEGSWILVGTYDKEEGAGDAGKLCIEAKNISFTGGAAIGSNTHGKGKGGELVLKASDSVSFSGENSNDGVSRILVGTDDKKEGAGDAGILNIEAKNISFTDGARIDATTLGKGKGGEVILKAAECVSFAGKSMIWIGTIEEDSSGDAGKLNIDSGNISFTDGAGIFSATAGKGKGGEVTLKAAESVSFAGEGSKADASGIIIGSVKSGGDSGNLIIDAKNISFTKGAYIGSNTEGKGKGGKVSLKASESVSFAGENSKAQPSRISIIGTREGTGDAGKLSVDARNISFTDGAWINSTTYGKGRGGEITLKASESVSFSGENSKTEQSGIGVATFSTEEGAGDAGKMTVDAKNISFTYGTWINSATYGKGRGGEVILKATESVSFAGESSGTGRSVIQITTADKEAEAGDAGKLSVDARNISFTDGAYIDSATYGKGRGGEVILKATESVSFAGESSRAESSMIQIATADKEAEAGDAGKLSVDARNISFAGGASINSATYGRGRGGEVSLKASESVSFSGENSKAKPSLIFIKSLGSGEEAGDAGKLSVEAKNISFTDGAGVSSGTEGRGSGGEVTLKASESVSFSGENSKAEPSRIDINSLGSGGDTGKLNVDAENIFFAGGASINSDTDGKGSGREVTLKASESVSFSGETSKAVPSGIMINSLGTGEGAGDAGKLSVEAKNISLSGGAFIDSSAYGSSKGGEVTLKASGAVSFSGENSKAVPSHISIKSFGSGEEAGDAGKLSVEAENILFTDGAGVSSGTEGRGKGGEVTLKASESVSFSGENSKAVPSGIYIHALGSGEGMGDAGKLIVEAKNISFAGGAFIDSTAFGSGKGGEVSLKASGTVSFRGESSGHGSYIQIATAEGATGDAGKLTMEAENISFTEGTYINSTTYGKGNGGEVTLKASESVSFSGEDSEAEPSRIAINSVGTGEGAGDAGKLSVEAKDILFKGGALISSTTYGKGAGGEVILKVSGYVSFEGESSRAETSIIQISTSDTEYGAGKAGKLLIEAESISFADGAFINSGTLGRGKGGEVFLNADTITLSGIGGEGYRSSVLAGSYNEAGNTGAGGKIWVSAKKLRISDEGRINTSGTGGGQAGDIALNVGSLEMSSGASVSSDATLSGGGRITVNAEDTVYLTDSFITTNVFSGTEKGGDITIGNPESGKVPRFVILNRSGIAANAYGKGDGGAVFIHTDHFLKSFGSIVEASSARGNEGTVRIEAPEEDVTAGLISIPTDFIDAGKWLPVPCSQRSGEKRSRFTIDCRDSVPTAPDGCLGGPVFELNSEK